MTEIKDCLPELARKHFINLRNIRLGQETEKYQTRLQTFRGEMAARGLLRSGSQELQEWKFKEEKIDALATGYTEDAIATIQLYDIPFTQQLRNCLEIAVGDMLIAAYQNALKTPSQIAGGTRVPNSIRQQRAGSLNGKYFRIMPSIKVKLEEARVADEKRRAGVVKEKEKRGDSYTQNIQQHGGVMNASMTGNVSTQQVIVADFDELRPALAQMRAFFKTQESSVENDEYIGLLASAEKAATEKDEGKLLGCLKAIPRGAWEIGKVVVPQVLLHYLKAHGMA
jgi:hypothetical protein